MLQWLRKLVQLLGSRELHFGNRNSRMLRLNSFVRGIFNETSTCLFKLSCAFLVRYDCLVASLSYSKYSHSKNRKAAKVTISHSLSCLKEQTMEKSMRQHMCSFLDCLLLSSSRLANVKWNNSVSCRRSFNALSTLNAVDSTGGPLTVGVRWNLNL